MATTTNWLKDNEYGEYAFVLAFEGMGLLYTTTQDAAGITTAWSGTDHSNFGDVKPGLMMVGETRQSISLFDPKVDADSMSFTLLDYDDTLLATMLAPGIVSSGMTYLTQTLDNNDTTINVKDSSSFSHPGAIEVFVGHECIACPAAGWTATTIPVTTRGRYSLFAASGSTRFGRRHTVQADATTSEAFSPAVSGAPRTWYNRTVALYLHHKENGAWSTKANSRMLWAGRIKGYGDNGDGTVTINCVNIIEALASSVFNEQFRAEVAEGFLLSTEKAGIRIRVKATVGGSSISYDESATIAGVGDVFTTGSLGNAISEQLGTWQAAASATERKVQWAFGTQGANAKGNNFNRQGFVKVRLDGSATEDSVFEFYMSPLVAQVFGFDQGPRTTDSSGREMFRVQLTKKSTSEWEALSPYMTGKSPSIPTQAAEGETFYIQEATGTWVNQTSLPSRYNGAEGFVQVGEAVYAVTYADPEFTMVGLGTQKGDEIEIERNLSSYEGDDPPALKQVWVETGDAGDILLRLMLSTGTAGYNHATYDAYGASIGLGLPYSLFNVKSFQTLNTEYELNLTASRSFRDILESVLAVNGRYLIFKDGQITLTYPGYDSPAVQDIVELTEANKGRKDDRSTIEYSADGLVNRMKLKYLNMRANRQYPIGHKLAKDNFLFRDQAEENVEHSASISDFGQRRTIEIDGTGVMDPSSWTKYVAAPLMAYFSQPLGIIRRSINARLVHLTPGSICTLDDDNLTDPRTGQRGFSGLACFVLSVSFDWEKGVGEVELAFLPSHYASRYATYAPSALVASYNAGTATLTMTANAYSDSAEGDAADASWFANGDLCQLRQIDPANPASPTVYNVTVSGTPSGNNVVLSSDPTAGAGLTAGQRYVLEYREATALSAASRTDQLDHAFIASATTEKYSGTTYDANLWAASNNRWNLAGGTYSGGTTQFVRPANDEGDAEEPLSVHKVWTLYTNANVLKQYKLMQTLVSEPYIPTVSILGTSPAILWGPVFLPLPNTNPDAGSTRQLALRVRFRRSGLLNTTTLTVYTSNKMPKGASWISFTRPGRTSSTSWSTTENTVRWVSGTESLMTPVIGREGDLAYTWLWVEGVSSNSLTQCDFSGIWVAEAALS